MKKLLKIVFTLLLLLITCLLIDIYLLRGFYTSRVITTENYGEYNSELKNKKLIYNIKKQGNEYIFTFRNTSINPFYFWTYRNDEVFQNVHDSVLFLYAGRVNINYPLRKDSLHYGFDCGTGVGETLILPFEKFKLKKNYSDLLKDYILIYDHYREENQDSIINDLLYDKPLFLQTNDKFNYIENKNIKLEDSVKLKFYLPVFSFKDRKISYAVSNEIKFAYTDIVRQILIQEKRLYE